jgi:hypothetical protein
MKLKQQKTLKKEMKKMKSSIREIGQEIEVSDDYEEKITRYRNREMAKRIMEASYKKKVIKYYEEERKRREMEKLFIEDNKFIISKKMWSHLRKQKEKLYLNKKVFRLNEKNWNIMNLNKGTLFDFETIKFLCNNFKRRSFMDRLDDYRCEQNYLNKLKESGLDNRIDQFEEIISYVMKKMKISEEKLPRN